MIRDEIKLLKLLKNCPNVIKIIKVWVLFSDFQSIETETAFFVCSEFYSGGDLLQLMEKRI